MDRREMFGVLGAGAIGLTAFGSRQASASAADEPSAKLDAIHKECLDACTECARACEVASNHCHDQVAKGNREHAKPLRYTTDCAGLCGLSATNIARRSPLMALSCEACAAACQETLAVVARSEMPEMKAATVALERCEKSCRGMLEAMGHHHHAPTGR